MNRERVLALAAATASQLAQPPAVVTGADRWRVQSLAKGAAGIALVHVERARAGLAPWSTAHAWLTTAATSGIISAASNAGLFNGAPAVAFALHAAGGGRYRHALARLDQYLAALADRKISLARDRIRRRELPPLAEFDLIYGLTGVGAYFLCRNAVSALKPILSYLVRLTEPVRTAGELVPGWWTSHDPSFRNSDEFAGGHANFGLAHGTAVISCVKSFSQVEAMSVVKSREARWS